MGCPLPERKPAPSGIIRSLNILYWRMFNELAGQLRMTDLVADRKEATIQVSNYAIMSTGTIPNMIFFMCLVVTYAHRALM
jgi:hypothetical protein